METLRRITSRPQAKPYRTRHLDPTREIRLDDDGLIAFGPADIENPKEWSRARRWYITLAAVILVMNASMASSSPSGCLPSIEDELHVSEEVAELTVTFFLVGFTSGPCLWAPLSEYYGRKTVLSATFIAYTAFTFLCAFTPNIEGLLIGRFLCGTFISGVLSNTPGIFADLWGPVERGNSMTLFTSALQMGPAIGPITSGFYQLKLNWRWNFYQLLWLAGASLLLLPTIPETLPSRALLAKAKNIRRAQVPGYEHVQAPIEIEQRSLAAIFKVALLRPWAIMIDPISFLVAVYITVVYALLYMLFTIFPIVFIEKRGWNAGVGELPLLSVCIGAVLAGIYIFWDSAQQRKRIAKGHVPVPEDALRVAMIGAVLFPIAMFWLGWTGEYNAVPWIVPTLAGVVLSIAVDFLFYSFLTYLGEAYLQYAASAQAANQIVRSAIAGASPLYANQMFDALGIGGGSSLIGGVALLLMPIPFVFYRYGATLRVRSKFAPTPDAPPGRATPDTKASYDPDAAPSKTPSPTIIPDARRPVVPASRASDPKYDPASDRSECDSSRDESDEEKDAHYAPIAGLRDDDGPAQRSAAADRFAEAGRLEKN